MSAIPHEVAVDKYSWSLFNLHRCLRPCLPYSKENHEKIKSAVVKQLEFLNKEVKGSNPDFNHIRDAVQFLVLNIFLLE